MLLSRCLAIGGLAIAFAAMVVLDDDVQITAVASLATPILALMYRFGRWDGELLIRLLIQSIIPPIFILYPWHGWYYGWICIILMACSLIWAQLIFDFIFHKHQNLWKTIVVILLSPVAALGLMALVTCIGEFFEPLKNTGGGLFLSAFLAISTLWIIWRSAPLHQSPAER